MRPEARDSGPLVRAAAITLLDGSQADHILDVLCDGFADYPIMRYVLGPGGDYSARLRTLIGFFAGNRFLRHDPVLGASVDGELRGVALCSLPDGVSPPEMDQHRERTWAALGSEARARYDRCVEVSTPSEWPSRTCISTCWRCPGDIRVGGWDGHCWTPYMPCPARGARPGG